MKKILVWLCLFLIVTNSCYANPLRYDGNGLYTYDNSPNVSLKGKIVTMAIADAETDLLSEVQWKNNVSENIVYYSETVISDNNNYTFSFKLPASGRYKAYVTIYGEETEIIPIEYINESNNKTATETIINATSVEIVKTALLNPKDLGIFDDIDKDEIAILIFKNKKSDMTIADITKLSQKSVLAYLIKNQKSVNIMDYKEIYDSDTLIYMYLNEGISTEVLKELDKTNFEENSVINTELFDKKLKESIVLATINTSSNDTLIKNILIDYASFLNIPTSKITNGLVNDIVSSGDFLSIDNLISYVNSYTPESDYTGNMNNGGGGGGGGAGGTYISKPSEPQVDENNTSDASKNNAVSMFDDIVDIEWAKDSINGLYRMGIINGKDENKFYPYDLVTREEFAKIISGAFKMNLIDDEFPFIDVTPEHWSYGYVKTAYLAGVTRGISDELFGIGQNITRQDLCVMIYNALKSCDEILEEMSDKAEFNDDNDIAEYAKNAVYYLQKAGVINGKEGNMFDPTGFATRAEAAKIVYQTISLKK